MTIKKHTKEYIHIRKRSFGYFFLTLFLILLTIGSFIVLIDSWRFLGLGGLECSKEDCSYNFHQLLILPILIINYIIISLTLCSFVSMFKKLKKHSEKGLVYELIDGLIDGLLVGLVFGLIIGLVFGLIIGLIIGLVFGLIDGLLVGLVFGLIIGLVFGLQEELK